MGDVSETNARTTYKLVWHKMISVEQWGNIFLLVLFLLLPIVFYYFAVYYGVYIFTFTNQMSDNNFSLNRRVPNIPFRDTQKSHYY